MAGSFNVRVLSIGFLVLALFWPIALALDRQFLFTILNTVAAALSVGVVITFIPTFLKLMRLNPAEDGPWQEQHWYLLGSFAVWTAIGGRLVWAWAVRYFNSPDWMASNILLAFLTYIAIVAAVSKLLAAKLLDPNNKGSRRRGIIAAGFMVITLLLLVLTGGVR